MTPDWIKNTRWLSLASMLALAASASAGCAADQEDGIVSDDGVASSTDDITQVDQTEVKRQSIGNCWLYATTSWLEALNKGATEEGKNTSESWLTYWHWFEQIANGRSGTEISTGGTYATAADLIVRYGVVLEKDFIAVEAEAEMSNRQSSALDAINRSLKSGALKDSAARRDRNLVRKELDAAWRLDAATSARIDAVFGKDVTRTLDKSSAAKSRAAANLVITPDKFEARLKDPASGEFVTGTLADALGTSSGSWYGSRQGKFAFNQVTYPRNERARRDFWKRVQRSLHDQIPVITSWKVDFNALSSTTSHFSLEELKRRGIGRQGGHMTVMHDYEAEVPGIGLLKAGEQATAEQMEAALSDDTVIHFVRVKNSWGGIRPDRWANAAIPGYHDLDLDYLNGPIVDCPEETVDKSTCTREVVPLWDVVLPAGY